MPTVESTVKSQFAKVFTVVDGELFKKVAESNLRESTALMKSDMTIEDSLKLIARNARKRLLIGIGVELLLKAIYLKRGFCINKPSHGTQLTFPFLAKDAMGKQLIEDQTVKLNDLIQHLPKIVQLQDQGLTLRGLQIAKVFRNKEGHVVTRTHAFEASNYRDIAASLTNLYKDAFREKLSAQFSLAPNEPPVWKISRLK